MTKSIKRLKQVDDNDIKITNKSKKTLNNGTTVHFATIKRNKSVTFAK